MNTFVNDGLGSILGSLGDPSRDKMAGTYYATRMITDYELLSAYRSSWLPRKVVDIPAMDSVRAWRSWTASPEQVGAIEREEKRLALRLKVHEAITKRRLFGGAAIYIGTGETNLEEPLDVARMGRGGIKFLTVLSRVECQAGDLEGDPISPYFGRPKFYRVNREGQKIHPSRFAIFTTQHPEPRFNMLGNVGWGDSALMPVLDALKHPEASATNASNLIFEANVDVFGVPDLFEMAGDADFSKRTIDRFILAAANKGINRSILMDKLESFERKAISFGGLPELLSSLMQMAAGAADIPATRLFGMSPSGMSSTGESDLRNYYDRVNVGQELETGPSMAGLDECLVRSALGSYPAECYYTWRPLWQMTAKEIAETAKVYTESAASLVSSGLVDIVAMGETLANQFAEIGAFPGIEDAMTTMEPDDDVSLNPDDETIDTTDAAPRSLYVSRKVTNGAEIVAWAKSQGFDPVPADELHVTIVYSRAPVDWIKVGESYSEELVVGKGGPRIVELFGAGSIVLQFANRELQWRHDDVMRYGGSHDFDEYQPHVTFSKFVGMPPVIENVTPYTGRIELGPEIFEELKA